MKKNDLQVIVEMWERDCEKGSTSENALVLFSGNLVGSKTVSQGGIIEMGVSRSALNETLTSKRFYLLLCVDREEFNRRKNEPEDSESK